MFYYKKFLIKETDCFDPLRYPRVDADLELIDACLSLLPAAFKTEMLLSCLQEHSIKTDWAVANPKVADLLSSKTLPLSGLKDLFACCQNNPVFRGGLETYIKDRFKASAVPFK